MSLSNRQKLVVDHVLQGKSLFFTGDAGTGKCLLLGTRVMQYNGKSITVENVKVGDRLMGDDNQPRTVLSTVTGRDHMYNVQQSNADNYTVNHAHVLSLQLSYDFAERWCVEQQRWLLYWFEDFDIKVESFDCCKTGIEEFKTATTQRNHHLDICEIGVDKYMEKSALWQNAFCGFQRPVVDHWGRQRQPMVPYEFGHRLGDAYRISNFTTPVCVPDVYKYANVYQRRELLAGFLDAQDDNFEFRKTSEIISDDIWFVAISLGCTVPLTPINVTYCGQNDYAGFQVDGNQRFCLADFTVTHNSHVLNHIITLLPQTTTFVTAMTGAAASKICGTTLHSFAGIGLGNGAPEDVLFRLSRPGRMNLATCGVLIIDEVSMLSAELFDKLEWIARAVRKNDAPFGGIQLLLTGDFYQIPPVNKKIHSTDLDLQMLFESSRFELAVPHIIELDEIFRQRDTRLIKMLNEVRYNKCSAESIQLLNFLKRPLEFDDNILPTKLFCKNIDVDTQNLQSLSRLPGDIITFTAVDSGMEPYKTNMDKHCIRPAVLQLKILAQVMLLQNMFEQKLVNGSRGVVIRFDSNLPVVQFADGAEHVIGWDTWKLEDRRGKVLASRYQIPLKLAWCMTIHKSQGMSIDRLEIKIDDAFDYGIAYVALSRATAIEGLCVVSYNVSKFRINPKVRKFYKRIREMNASTDVIG